MTTRGRHAACPLTFRLLQHLFQQSLASLLKVLRSIQRIVDEHRFLHKTNNGARI
ncbi:hypothetical protein BD414DRAFT_500790 [Trametes punicea]|nr:hypothetical protein BD414DRAFT_500790 [Trametes punicea]